MTNVILNHLTPERPLDEHTARDRASVMMYFAEYLSRFAEFRPEDLSGLEQYWTIRHGKKNELLFSEYEPVPELSFIAKGAVKLHKENGKGYQVMALLTEANFCSQKKTFCSQKPAGYNAQCVEPTVLVTISCQQLDRLLRERPVFNNYFIEQSENIIQFLMQRLNSFQMLSAQQRYEELLSAMPDVINRFTLSDIANYLGMKGETLSRVRSSLSKKDFKIAS